MRTLLKALSCLTPVCLTLAACSGSAPSEAPKPPQHAAHLYIMSDVSGTSVVQGDNVVGNALRQRVADAVKTMELGDSVTVVEVGSRSAERFVARPTITTGPKLRQAAASRKVVAQMEDIASSYRANGGDGGTNLLLALDTLRPDCRSGRSVIMIVSDGIESSEAYDAVAALNAGKPIELPPPPSSLLRGCQLEFVGFGVAADGSGKGAILPEVHLRALRKGWEKYLTAGGVAASDMTFTSRI